MSMLDCGTVIAVPPLAVSGIDSASPDEYGASLTPPAWNVIAEAQIWSLAADEAGWMSIVTPAAEAGIIAASPAPKTAA
ncbi:MAG: hypothetical protein ABR964_16535 [Tepidisphaeraceae bacterium]